MIIDLWIAASIGLAFLSGMALEHVINEKRWRKWRKLSEKKFAFWDNEEDEIWNDQ